MYRPGIIALGMVALVLTLVWAGGFAFAVYDVVSAHPPAAPPERPSSAISPGSDTAIRLVGLGDSLTRGAGDPEGLGYLGRLRQQVAEARKQPVYVHNLAVNGYRSDQLLNRLRTEPAFRQTVARADLITLSIGGNDLRVAAQETGVDLAHAQRVFDETLVRVVQIVTELRAINPRAPIVYVGLYNPYARWPEGEAITALIERWNAEVAARTAHIPNVAVVPLVDVFRFHLDEYLAVDRFHPNDAGYAAIAERLWQVVR
ncbi:MAG: GDSL-type esterase/lipase family protein [Calditerricola sp.]|nr:GDSL-type esterase/lipase family protein [Calditerricola sp.]